MRHSPRRMPTAQPVFARPWFFPWLGGSPGRSLAARLAVVRGRACRLLLGMGISLVLGAGLFAAAPRAVVDDEAYTKSALDGATDLHKNGKLVAIKTLLAQAPSKDPLKFLEPNKESVAPTELYNRLRAGTVAIGMFYRCHKCSKWHHNLATGFAVGEGGIVSTCAHVLDYDEEEMEDAFVFAVDADGRAYPVDALLARDEESDTCLVRVAGAKLSPLPLRAGALPGETVFCMGHPGEHYYMFSQGIVARVSRSSIVQADEEAPAKSRPTLSLEVTSEFSPGSSGGAIVDGSGNVVAQVDAIETDTDTDAKGSGVVIMRSATAAEEILRFADPANRPTPKPVEKLDPAEALAALAKAVETLGANEDEEAEERLLAKVVGAVKRARPAIKDPAPRREFALLAAEGLSQDATNKELKNVLPMLEQIVADQDASPEQKRKASHFLVAFAAEDVDSAEAFAAFEKKYLAHASSFPEDSELSELKLLLLELAGEYHRLDVVQRFSGDKDEEVAERAKETLAAAKAKQALRSVPLELKFTAFDGTGVDFKKLRGKVVLLDFWATWCGPCMKELPNVKEAYARLHSRGFEIVGISLDEDKKKLAAVLKAKGVEWPQHFDGKAWESPLVKRFGVTALPSMWLLNKKGMVEDFDASGADLRAKIEKLLSQ